MIGKGKRVLKLYSTRLVWTQQMATQHTRWLQEQHKVSGKLKGLRAATADTIQRPMTRHLSLPRTGTFLDLVDGAPDRRGVDGQQAVRAHDDGLLEEGDRVGVVKAADLEILEHGDQPRDVLPVQRLIYCTLHRINTHMHVY